MSKPSYLTPAQEAQLVVVAQDLIEAQWASSTQASTSDRIRQEAAALRDRRPAGDGNGLFP